MNTMKCNIRDNQGRTLLTCNESRQISLVYAHEYNAGDKIVLELAKPDYLMMQLEDTMPEVLVYCTANVFVYPVPTGAGAVTYSPKNFAGNLHIIRARFATEDEISARRNLAFNPYDIHGESPVYPHAWANVETRGEAVFAARNAIDGVFENSSHGIFPYQSWGINRDPNAALTVSFGRKVVLDEIRITERADFPHDSYWTSARVTFSDGSSETLSLVKSEKPQCYSIEPKQTEYITLSHLIKAEDESPFPALTQIEAYGKECAK